MVKSSKYVCVGQLVPNTGLGLVSNLLWVWGCLYGSVATPGSALMVYQGRGDKLELVCTVTNMSTSSLQPTDVQFPALCSPVI